MAETVSKKKTQLLWPNIAQLLQDNIANPERAAAMLAQ